MVRRPTHIGPDTAPQDFPQVTPRDLHPTSDIRFVITEVAKLTTQVERLIQDVGKLDTKVDAVCHQVTFVKGALWVIGGLMAIMGVVATLYFGGHLSVTLTPGK